MASKDDPTDRFAFTVGDIDSNTTDDASHLTTPANLDEVVSFVAEVVDPPATHLRT